MRKNKKIEKSIEEVKGRIEQGANRLPYEYRALYYGTLREAFNLGRLMTNTFGVEGTKTERIAEYLTSRYLNYTIK